MSSVPPGDEGDHPPFRPSSNVDRALLVDFLARELLRDSPRRRDLTCVNVDHGWKERFDRLQDLLSARAGRRLTQWEAFAVLVALAEEEYGYELGAMRGR